MTPLVSVMMPCYNAVRTLPKALSSLIAQTCQNWECILVDGGPNGNPHDIVRQVNDQRNKFIRLEKNMGRGVASQTALEKMSGEFLCMLDADDWLYPTRIQAQVDVMKDEPKAALVSSGMAIVNKENEMVGVRARGGVRRFAGFPGNDILPR